MLKKGHNDWQPLAADDAKVYLDLQATQKQIQMLRFAQEIEDGLSAFAEQDSQNRLVFRKALVDLKVQLQIFLEDLTKNVLPFYLREDRREDSFIYVLRSSQITLLPNSSALVVLVERIATSTLRDVTEFLDVLENDQADNRKVMDYKIKSYLRRREIVEDFDAVGLQLQAIGDSFKQDPIIHSLQR